MPAADPEPPSAGPRLELLLDVDDGVRGELPPHAFLADWAGRALDGALASDVRTGWSGAGAARAELSVRLLDVDAMRALNRDWRGRDAPTNVLSFPSDLPPLATGGATGDGTSDGDDAADGDGTLLALGDVALCPTVVEEEARVQGKPVADHWAHLVVHGVLHLCGLDHESDDDARIMEGLETRLLAARDLPDPYGDRTTP